MELKVRGYQKKVIFLKDTGSHLFDEAYFVISRKGEEAKIDQSDMVLEANRIIKESLKDKESRVKGEKRQFLKSFVLPFTLGVFASAVIMAGVFIIFIR